MEMLEHNASAGALELGTLNPRACHRDDEGPSFGFFPFGGRVGSQIFLVPNVFHNCPQYHLTLFHILGRIQ
jgi:hypothetical protein